MSGLVAEQAAFLLDLSRLIQHAREEGWVLTGLLAWWLGNLVRSGTKQPNPSTASAGGLARPFLLFRLTRPQSTTGTNSAQNAGHPQSL